MVAVNMGSFLDLGLSLERFAIAAVVGVLLLVVYEAVILITALLATRTNRPAARPATGGGSAEPMG
ncbi:MAG: hypothetical protein PVH00_03185 [Gemmatimonadota bacterium]